MAIGLNSRLPPNIRKRNTGSVGGQRLRWDQLITTARSSSCGITCVSKYPRHTGLFEYTTIAYLRRGHHVAQTVNRSTSAIASHSTTPTSAKGSQTIVNGKSHHV